MGSHSMLKRASQDIARNTIQKKERERRNLGKENNTLSRISLFFRLSSVTFMYTRPQENALSHNITSSYCQNWSSTFSSSLSWVHINTSNSTCCSSYEKEWMTSKKTGTKLSHLNECEEKRANDVASELQILKLNDRHSQKFGALSLIQWHFMIFTLNQWHVMPDRCASLI